jgi:urease accessory protein
MNLRLLQLGDSALPIGGYSHSWGLEAAIDRGDVRDPPTLERWVRLWLRDSFGPCEGVVVAAVCRGAAAADANDLLEASIVPTTLRLASREMGGQLLNLAERWEWAAVSVAGMRYATAEAPEGRPSVARGGTPGAGGGRAGIEAPEGRHSSTPWHHAPVFATLAAAAGAAPTDALLVYLHQAALGVIGAGVRAVPIGHTHGQQVLSRLHDDVRDLAAELAGRDLDTAGSFSPAYEILCDAQTHLYTRIFRS